MKIKYVRFLQSVGSPGHSGTDITSAKLSTKATDVSTPRDQLMDGITIEKGLLVLTKMRMVRPPAGGPAREHYFDRYVPLANVRDFELVDELVDEPPTPKEPAR